MRLTDEVPEEKVETTRLELKDPEGQPLANQPYRIVMSDGSEVSGVLDEINRKWPFERNTEIRLP